MRLHIMKSACVGCGACACEKADGAEEMKALLRCDPDHCSLECVTACPKNAVVLSNGFPVILAEECDGCGACARACPFQAVLIKGRKAVKCDLCYSRGFPACVSSCPYSAIEMVLNDSEKKIVDSLLGYEKRKILPARVEWENDRAMICEDEEGKKWYVTKRRPPWIEEAKVLHGLLKHSLGKPRFEPEEELEEYCERQRVILSPGTREFLVQEMEKELRGYSVLSEFLQDPLVEEVTVTGPGSPVRVYHSEHGWPDTNVRFTSDQKIVQIANKMARGLGRRLSAKTPRINADIPLGRIHAVQPPVSAGGTVLTIRKFRKEPLTPGSLIRNGTCTPELLAWLWEKILEGRNVLVCGSTGSGKTTTLNALLCLVPLNERIVIVEETPEIVAPHEHVVRMVCSEDQGTSMSSLVADTMRMRPDRVVVGEVRKREEVSALVDTMLAGQGKSCFATFHARSPEQTVQRLESLGVGKAFLTGFDVIVCQNRWTDYSSGREVRRVTHASVMGQDGLEPVFLWKKGGLEKVSGGRVCPDKKRFLESCEEGFREYASRATALVLGKRV